MVKGEVMTGQECIEIHSNPAIAELIEARDAFVKSARKVSKDQVDLWRQVPWLALQADGRTGHLDHYSYAYNYGYWDLEVDQDEYFTRGVTVDLETGELMDAATIYGTNSDPESATFSGVLSLLGNPDLLDAHAVVKRLSENAKKSHGSSYNEEEKEAWRQEVIERFGLSPIYSRRKVVNPTEPEFLNP